MTVMLLFCYALRQTIMLLTVIRDDYGEMHPQKKKDGSERILRAVSFKSIQVIQ